jgi:exopolysaccharide biosynthesis polyprenyl glycosylphosphotransferase
VFDTKTERPVAQLSIAPKAIQKKRLTGLPELIFFLTDILAIALSIVVGYFIRFAELEAKNELNVGEFAIQYRHFLFGLGIGWLCTLAIFNTYKQIRPLDYFVRLKQALKTTALFFFTIGFVCFTLKISLSRLLISTIFLLSVLAFSTLRALANFVIERFVKSTIEIRSNLLVIGSDSVENSRYIDWIRKNKHYGLKVQVNIIIKDFDSAAQARVKSAIQEHEDTKVLLLPSLGTDETLRELIWFCEAFNCDIYLAPQLTSKSGYWLTPKHEVGMPFFTTAKPKLSTKSRFMKRSFDIAFAIFALVITAPVFLIISAIIIATDGMPVFYKSRRVGIDGIPFNFIKFRTMIKNADKMVDQVQNMHPTTHVLFKNPSDPRITPIGRYLRRYSLDELPQFINVLKGDMSVVGPRPPIISEALRYDDLSQRRLYVRPGLTGPWQVSGRSDLDWEMSVRLDLDYAANWKFTNDLWLILRTILVVFTGKGAY